MKEKERRLTAREHTVVPRSNAMCESDHDARVLLARVLGVGDSVECVPLESDAGRRLHFATACDGRGYTLSYRTEQVGEGSGLVRVVDAKVERNEVYDRAPKDYAQYRITFYGRSARMNPLEFAWLLSKHEVEVVAKADACDVIFVRAASRKVLLDWANDVNHAFGPLIFETIEGAGPQGYEEIEL